MSFTVGGSTPQLTFADATVQNTAALPLTGGSVSADITVHGLTVGQGGGAVSTNTAVGASALVVNTGADNCAVGYQALSTNTSGTENASVGWLSLNANTTGSYGTALGAAALFQNTTGSNNTAIGDRSLFTNTTASNNTAVGYQAGYSGTTGAQNTFIGNYAGYSNITGSYNVFVGRSAGYSTTGGQNTFVGDSAGYSVTSGTKNTIIGEYNGNQGGLDIRTSSNYIVLSDGDGNPRAYWNTGGSFYCPRVYIDTTASGANVYIDSTGLFYRSTSALKYKQDVRDLEDLDISTLRPVRYKSKCEGDDQTKDHLGLIADEAAEAGFEELVTRGADGEIEGFQYERLTVVLLKKLQVLESEFKAYKEAHP